MLSPTSEEKKTFSLSHLVLEVLLNATENVCQLPRIAYNSMEQCCMLMRISRALPLLVVGGSSQSKGLEVKFPTIWRDEKEVEEKQKKS